MSLRIQCLRQNHEFRNYHIYVGIDTPLGYLHKYFSNIYDIIGYIADQYRSESSMPTSKGNKIIYGKWTYNFENRETCQMVLKKVLDVVEYYQRPLLPLN